MEPIDVVHTPFTNGVWTRLWRRWDRAVWRHEDDVYAAHLFEKLRGTTAWSVSSRGIPYRNGIASDLDTAKSQALDAVAELKQEEAQLGRPDHPSYPLLAEAYERLERQQHRGLSSSIGCVINALWYGRTVNSEGIETVEDALGELVKIAEGLPGVIGRAKDTDVAEDVTAAATALAKAIQLLQDEQIEE